MSTTQRTALSLNEKESPKVKPARRKTLILVGGGHVHVQVLRHFRVNRPENVEVVLISETDSQLYSGMLPGLMGGFYRVEQCQFDLPKLCRQIGARFVKAQVTGLDVKNQKVITAETIYDFDWASINVGSRPTLAKTDARATPLKPLHLFYKKWLELMANKNLRLAILGGGTAGVEVALMAAAQLNKIDDNFENTKKTYPQRVTLYETAPQILASLPARARRIVEARARILNLKIVTHFSGDTKDLTEDVLFLATSPQAPGWFNDTALPLSKNGFLAVDEHLNAVDLENIFGAGDCIEFTPAPHAHAGVYAVRHAPVLAENILHRIYGDTGLRRFEPQHDFLHLLTLGGPTALLIRRPIVFASRLNWYLKDIIDQKFMK